MDSQLSVPVFSGDGVPNHDGQDQSQRGQEFPACRANAQKSWKQQQAGTAPGHLLSCPSWGPCKAGSKQALAWP